MDGVMPRREFWRWCCRCVGYVEVEECGRQGRRKDVVGQGSTGGKGKLSKLTKWQLIMRELSRGRVRVCEGRSSPDGQTVTDDDSHRWDLMDQVLSRGSFVQTKVTWERFEANKGM